MVVTGVQEQIDAALRERRLVPKYMGGYRITDRAAMDAAIDAVGRVRVQCLQAFSKVRACGQCLQWFAVPATVIVVVAVLQSTGHH